MTAIVLDDPATGSVDEEDSDAVKASKRIIVGEGYWVYANADGVIIP